MARLRGAAPPVAPRIFGSECWSPLVAGRCSTDLPRISTADSRWSIMSLVTLDSRRGLASTFGGNRARVARRSRLAEQTHRTTIVPLRRRASSGQGRQSGTPRRSCIDVAQRCRCYPGERWGAVNHSCPSLFPACAESRSGRPCNSAGTIRAASKLTSGRTPRPPKREERAAGLPGNAGTVPHERPRGGADAGGGPHCAASRSIPSIGNPEPRALIRPVCMRLRGRHLDCRSYALGPLSS